MKFQIKSDKLAKTSDYRVIGIYDSQELTHPVKIPQYEISTKIGEVTLLRESSILLVGCGKRGQVSPRDYRTIITNCIKTLNAAKIKYAIFCLAELKIADFDLSWKIKQLVIAAVDASYQFNQFKSQKEPKPSLQNITLYLPEKQSTKDALKEALAITSGMTLTKNLGNMPSNIATPTYLAEQAKLLAKEHPAIKVKIIDKQEMKKLGMGALLAVAQGSKEEPKLICLEYHGANQKSAPIAFVGKGITYDTGGISLKPTENMIGMKYDMCGAASILGTFKSVAELKLPINLIGILASAENMPDGGAYKPEDIVTSLSGQTIEIMNTDAEGRLVLADALTYVERYHPEIVIDIATLTASVVIALGFHVSALLSNDQALADDLLKAGIKSHDRAWQMPLWEEYQDQLRSPFADMSNTGGRPAGVVTAACFLSRFTKKFRWAHLDVAGTAAMMMGVDRYATGRPVPLLVEYLLGRCHAKN